MNSSVVELFAHAADRAKHVAVMMEAACALTVLGRARLGTETAADTEPAVLQVAGLYQTAERLGEHVRQVSSEARTLLLTARQMLDREPALHDQVPADFDEVCRMMEDAMSRAVEAIERLEAMRLTIAPAADTDAADDPPPSAEAQQAASALFLRLRNGAAPGV
jgi:hypothetical protein